MAYSVFVENISNAIEDKMKQMSSIYNFDNGPEFEIALCELLRQILPDKYGICRGFVVTENIQTEGDDIIIYDRDRFPTLRLFSNSFDKKQQVPIEAVYCYIEVKHTLILQDSDSGQSLYKALSQVHKIKSLPREKRPLFSIDHYTVLTDYMQTGRSDWPDFDNPIFGAIIARHVKVDTSSKTNGIIDPEIFSKCKVPPNVVYPDLVVMGHEDLLFPGLSTQDKITYASPFFIPGKSTMIHKKTKTSALSVGILMMLFALDNIKLGKMPYETMIKSQLQS
jgi:hypothetical protein